MRKYTIDEIREKAVPIAKKYGVGKLALFGSYARGDSHAGSDIDFVIELGAIQGLEFFGFALDLEDEFKIRVDIVTYASAMNSIFLRNAFSNEVILYESG